MAHVRNRLELSLGLLVLLVLHVVVGCGSLDSSADEPLQLDTAAVSEHLRLATLRVTGMS